MRRDNHTGCLALRGKIWYARWMYQGKVRQRSTGTSDKAKAKKVLKRLTAPFQRQDVSLADALRDTLKWAESIENRTMIAVKDLWKVYESEAEWGGVSAESKDNYRVYIEKMAERMAKLGCRFVSDITVEKAKAYCKELQEKYVEASYNNRLSQFRKVWNVLVESGKWAIVPGVWDKRKYLKAGNSMKKPFTPGELRKMLELADEDMRLAIIVGMNTGMRKVDVANLLWEDVDLENRRMLVTPCKTRKHGKKVRINLNEELFQALSEARGRSSGEYVSEKNAREYETGTFDDRFARLMDSCDIERQRKDEKGRMRSHKGFHSLRHFTASALYAAGVSKVDIARILGDDVDMMDTYIDVDFADVLRNFEWGAKKSA